MKDLYTFDTTLDTAKETYDIVNAAYTRLFQKIQVPFCKVSGDTGIMGGSLSHEYHFPAAVGEDSLLNCAKCGYSCNKELAQDACPKCKSTDFKTTQGIEIAHTFVLEDKYTKPLKATYLMSNGKPTPLIMGCYGIGISRLVAASLEVLSTENELRWPFKLAPFDICIISPKSGSKEDTKQVQEICASIERELKKQIGEKNFVVDDRTNLTIGKRLMEAKRMGYPFIVVVGEKASSENHPQLELHDLVKEEQSLFEPSELLKQLFGRIKSLEI